MDLHTVLSTIELFSRLDPDQIDALTAIVTEYNVSQGDIVSHQADVGKHMYLFLEGTATAHRIDEHGFRKPVVTFEPGDAYGTTSLFLDSPRDATVAMKSDGRLGIITQDAFSALLDTATEIDRALVLSDDLIDQLENAEYDWLADGEMVLYAEHRHWSVLAIRLMRDLLFLGLYAAAVFGAQILYPSLYFIRAFAPGLIIYCLATLFKCIDWYDDVLVVTTRRISHRERVALLYETLQEAPLDRIQNINVDYHFPGSLWGIGDITFATAAQVGNLTFTSISHPEQVREDVFRQIEKLQALRKASQRDVIRQELSGRLNETLPVLEDDTLSTHLPVEQPADTSPFTEEHLKGKSVPTKRLARILNWLVQKGWILRTRFDENGTITWRKHWLFLVGGMLRPLLLTCALIALTVLAQRGLPGVLVLWIPGYPAILMAMSVLSLVWFWWTANDWANDLYIITPDRVIDIERRPLSLSLERREASLGMIQNVSLSVGNVFAAILNYGDVIVQTAGAGDFTFHHVANPRQVQKEIFDHLEAFREKQRQQDASQRRTELAEWLTVYDQLRHGETDTEADPATEL